MTGEDLESRILRVRGVHVMLDRDLAAVFNVATKVLNQTLRRNRERFPSDFVFQLTSEETRSLRSQIVTSKRGGARHAPWAFTEHGAIMAATLLRGWRAVELSVFVVRAFVRLRNLAGTSSEVAARLSALERKVTGHDEELRAMFAALRALVEPARRPRRRIGFRSTSMAAES